MHKRRTLPYQTSGVSIASIVGIVGSIGGKLWQYMGLRTDTILWTVFKNSGWAAGGQAVNVSVAFIETILLARFLPIETFGVFVVLVSAVELVYGLLDFRSGEAVIKFLPELQRSQGTQYVSAFLKVILFIDGCVAVAGFLLIAVFGSLVARWLSIPTDYVYYIVILAVGLALRSAVRSVGSFLRVSGRFSLSVKLGVISSLLRLFLLSGAIIIQATIDIVTWAVVLSDFAFFGLMAVSAFYSFHTLQYHPFRTPIKVITQHGEPIRTFLISNNLAGTMRIISSKLDVIVIAALSSPAVVALYKVAARIAGTVIMFSDPLLLALYPEMSHLHASNSTQQLKRIVSSLTKTLTLLATSVVIGFVVFGNWVLNHIVGVQYTDAFSVVLIMFIGTSVAMIFFWARPLLLVSGVAGKLVLVGVASIVLQFVVLYFLVPTMGAKGAGIALTVHYLINISLLLYLVITSVEFLPLKNEIENA